MKLALLGSRGYPSTYGGYETFVRHFVPYAVDRGHDVIVYCRWKHEGQAVWEVGGAECRASLGRDTKFLSTPSFGLTSSVDVLRRGADVALVLNCANGLWLPLLNAGHIPVAMNVDGIEWQRGKWNSLARATLRTAARMASRRADRLIADSQAIAGVWRIDFGVKPEFIPYGAPIVVDDAADELDALGIPKGEYVLTVARLAPENNVELVLDALETMSPRPPHVVVGSANYKSDLETRLGSLSHRPDVWWLGHVSNQRLLTQLWRHCAVYVHGHSIGGTNPALLQALGAGAPTLAYDCIFNREVIGEEDVYFSEAPRSLARQLERTLNSDASRRAVAERARERVRDAYSWSDVCNKYLDLLERLAAKGR